MIGSSKLLEIISYCQVEKWHVMIALVILIISLILSSYLKQQKFNFYPGLRPLPIIGNMHQMAPHVERFIPWMGDILEEYGGTTALWMGRQLVVATNDVNLIQTYYATPQSNANFQKDIFRDTVAYGLGDGLLTSAGKEWEFSRKNLAPTFTSTALKNFVPILEKNTERFLLIISEQLEDSKVVAISRELNMCTLRNIAETFLQLREEDIEDPKKIMSHLDTIMHLLQQRGFSPWQNPDAFYHLLPSGRLALKIMTEFKGFLESVRNLAAKRVEERQLEGENEWKKKVFINVLVQNKGFSTKQVIDELATVIATGMETTSNAVGFTLLALGQNPDIQQKVLDEDTKVRQEIGGRDFEYSDFTKYTYLERVIKEILRLFPIIPLFYRRLTEDLDCGTHIIPTGTELIMHLLSVHRDPKHYPDPLVFDPDRFLPENVAKRPVHSYMPFGWGSRICIGQKFSMMSMKLIISTVVRNFRVYNDVPLDQLRLNMDISLKDADGVRLRLERR